MARTKAMPPTTESIHAKWEELELFGEDTTTLFIKAVWAQMILGGVNTNDLHLLTQIHPTAISRTLNNRGGSPTLETVDRYAAAFGMTSRELFDSIQEI